MSGLPWSAMGDATLSIDEVRAALEDEALSYVMARPESYGYVNRAPQEAVRLVLDVLASHPERAGQLAAAIDEQAAHVAQERREAEEAAKTAGTAAKAPHAAKGPRGGRPAH